MAWRSLAKDHGEKEDRAKGKGAWNGRVEGTRVIANGAPSHKRPLVRRARGT